MEPKWTAEQSPPERGAGPPRRIGEWPLERRQVRRRFEPNVLLVGGLEVARASIVRYWSATRRTGVSILRLQALHGAPIRLSGKLTAL